MGFTSTSWICGIITSGTRLRCSQYSELTWRRYLNPTSNHNRLRLWDYRRIFEGNFREGGDRDSGTRRARVRAKHGLGSGPNLSVGTRRRIRLLSYRLRRDGRCHEEQMDRLLTGITLGGWAIPWIAGGMLLANGIFRLRRDEVAIVGFSLGLVLELWLANMLAQRVSVPLAFWLASVVRLGCRHGASGGARRLAASGLQSLDVGGLGGLTLLFNGIGRGLGVFDDYQNLPTVSFMAAGDVPPHFALDPRYDLVTTISCSSSRRS